MEKIIIIMVTDENYILPTKVAVSSVLTSAHTPSLFEVHILCKKGMDFDSRNQFKALEQMYNNLEIRFHEIEDSVLEKARTTAHIPVASYYRLYISRIIDDDRCLYIDGDMLIQEDLSQIYNMELGDFYIAGVRDMGVQANMDKFSGHSSCLGIPSMDEYVNAGFLLFNLKKIREDGIDQLFISAISHGYPYMDQDIINKYCYGKIKYLPTKYDYFTEYGGDAFEACVLHYTGYFKPWICSRLKINRLWWEQAKQALNEEEYNLIKKQAGEAERISDWSYVLDRVKEEKEVVIFGFSEIGKNVADRLVKTGEGNIVAFADNDIRKAGLEYEKIPVMSMAEIRLNFSSPFFIISSQNGFRSISSQLKELGIPEKKIIRYIYKDKTYYERLDEKYSAYESEKG